MHPQIHAERSLLPRALIARRPIRTYICRHDYRFDVSDTVRFFDHFALVTSRSLSARGREIYHIQLISGEMDGRPFRTVEGSHLTAAENPYGKNQAHSIASSV